MANNRNDWSRSSRDQERYAGPWRRSNDSSRPYDDYESSDLSSYGERQDRSQDRSAYTRADQGTRADSQRSNYDRYSSQNDYRMGSDGTVPSGRGGYDRYASQQQDYGMGSDVYGSRNDSSRYGEQNRTGDSYSRDLSNRSGDMYGRDMYNRNSFDENDYGRQSYNRSRSNPSSTYQGSYEATPSAGAYGLSRNHTGRGPKGWQRSDENIRERVCERLERDPNVDASEIEVAVASGIVTLSGKVDTRNSKRHTEDIVESLAGVKDVRSELSVDQSFWQQAKDMVTGGESKASDKTEANGSRSSLKSSSASKSLSH